MAGAALAKDGYIYLYKDTRTSAPTSAPTIAPTALSLVSPVTTDPPGKRPWTSISMSDDGLNVVAVDKGGLIYTSADGGSTWVSNPATGNQTWTGVASSGNGQGLVAVTADGAIYTSTDAGLSWTSQPNVPASQNWTSVTCTGDGQTMVATADNGLVYTSTDGGVTWSSTTSPSGNRAWSSVDSSSSGTIQIAAEKVERRCSRVWMDESCMVWRHVGSGRLGSTVAWIWGQTGGSSSRGGGMLLT